MIRIIGNQLSKPTHSILTKINLTKSEIRNKNKSYRKYHYNVKYKLNNKNKK